MPDPGPIMQISTAYWSAQVLLTANRLGVFDVCAGEPQHPESIAESLGLAVRPTDLFLRSLVGLGMLECTDAGFRNTTLANAYLVSTSPAYMGNALRYSDNLYATWGDLEKGLRDDRPVMPAETYLGSNAATTRDFVYGMHDRAIGIGRALAEIVDLSGRTSLLDVGGGPGTYSAMFARKYPELKSTVLELPGVAEIAAEILESMHCADRVSLLPGSYLETPFPGGNDAVLISGVFHRETEQNCRVLIEKAHGSLVSGGLLVISDVFADAGGVSPPFAVLFGLNMMLTAPDGGVHADADVAHWMEDAGFRDAATQKLPPPMPHRVVTAIKS